MILDLAWIGAAWLGVASLGIMLFGVAWIDVAWLGTASCGLRSLNSTLRGFVLLIVVFVSLDVNFPVISTVSSTFISYEKCERIEKGWWERGREDRRERQ